jgi:hypothetical protein
LPQDLHAFLHDLFRALRQEGHTRHEGDDSRHSQLPPAPISTTPVPTPVTTTSTGTITTPGTTPVTTTPPATTPATPPTSGTGTSIAQYGHRGIIAELTALIKDLGNSGTTSGAASTPSRVSADTLANLNAAFAKLIGDFGGTASGASTGTTAVPPATDPSTPATTVPAGPATTPATTAGSHPDTAALQSFLTSFLQGLQGSSGSAAGTLGNGVNVTA